MNKRSYTYTILERCGRNRLRLEITISEGKRSQSTEYLLCEEPSSEGFAVRISKPCGEPYATPDRVEPPYIVLVLEGDAGCNCWGFTRHKHCKHADLVLSLLDKRELTEEKPDLAARVAWQEESEIFI